MAKVYRSLKPGGWWAMWWNHFGSEEPDDFHRATDHLFVGTADSPAWSGQKRIPFALDRDRRLEDLTANGFQDAEVDIWRSSLTCDTASLVALYSTFSPVRALEQKSRQQLLADLARIANEQFGGRVERPLITVLYTAQKR